MPREKVKGACEHCGKVRVLSRYRKMNVCRKCMSEIAKTSGQKILEKEGVSGTDRMTSEEAREITSALGHAYHYALDVWEMVRGDRIIRDQQSSASRDDVYKFIVQVFEKDREFIDQIVKVQISREAEAKTRQAKTGAEYAKRAPITKDNSYRHMVELLAEQGVSMAQARNTPLGLNKIDCNLQVDLKNDASESFQWSGCLVLQLVSIVGIIGAKLKRSGLLRIWVLLKKCTNLLCGLWKIWALSKSFLQLRRDTAASSLRPQRLYN